MEDNLCTGRLERQGLVTKRAPNASASTRLSAQGNSSESGPRVAPNIIAASSGGGASHSWSAELFGPKIAPTSPISAEEGLLSSSAASSSASSSPIKVFATGGLGGVHRGGELSMDISADLYEFARSPMGLVSAGFKSFLDVHRSLEFLETMGATVMSLGAAEVRPQTRSIIAASTDADNERLGPRRNGAFPGFFVRDSGAQSPLEVDSIREAAHILFACLDGAPLLDRRAALLAVPVAQEFDLSATVYGADCWAAEVGFGSAKVTETLNGKQSADRPKWLSFNELLRAIQAQVDSLEGIAGSAKTPLILERLNRATRGKSLETNVALLRNNARVGARLAYEYALLANRTGKIGAASAATAPKGYIFAGFGVCVCVHEREFAFFARRAGLS